MSPPRPIAPAARTASTPGLTARPVGPAVTAASTPGLTARAVGPAVTAATGRAAAGRMAAAGLAALLSLTACSFGQPEPDRAGKPPSFASPTAAAPSADGPGAATGQPGGLVITVLARDLRVPWGVAFLPDGGALVTERDSRRLLKIGPESGPDGLVVTTVQTIEEAEPDGEGGLLGVTVSPRYATDRTLFIYYTTKTDNRIASLILGGKPKPIVTGIPVSGIHNGGRLAFGPDGYLYATTGDGSQRGLAQNRASLGGKILRMTPQGKPAPGNPFKTLVWSYGHRNVQGIAWDPDKNLYAIEFGQSAWDEVNRVQPGRNYGWPQVEGTGTDQRYVNPLVTWPVAEASCSGAATLQRTLVTACLRGERLWLLEVTAQGAVFGRPHPLLVGEFGRLRTVVAAPDGSLWITTSNHDGRGKPAPEDDRLLRLVLPDAGGAGKS